MNFINQGVKTKRIKLTKTRKNKKTFKRLLSNVPFIIGKIDIVVNVSDSDSGVNRVEFFIDNELKANISSSPYSWIWDNIAFFKHTIIVTAYDNAGNHNSAEIIVSKFF